ncbi:MAG: hypothetical protein ACRC1J_07065 [Sandaracinobacteroides sp.]
MFDAEFLGHRDQFCRRFLLEFDQVHVSFLGGNASGNRETAAAESEAGTRTGPLEAAVGLRPGTVKSGFRERRGVTVRAGFRQSDAGMNRTGKCAGLPAGSRWRGASAEGTKYQAQAILLQN